MGTFTLEQSKNDTNLFVYPNTDLNDCTDWTPVGDIPNYKCIDEGRYVPDGDTTHVMWDDVANGIDMYTLPNDTDFIGTINYVQVFTRAKSHQFSQSPSGIFKILCSPTSTCSILFKSNNKNLNTGYQTYTHVWTLNPDTLLAWTLNDIKNLSIGIEASSPTRSGVSGMDIYIPNAGGSSNTHGWFTRPFPPESGAGTSNNYLYIKESDVDKGIASSTGIYRLDLYNIPNHKTINVNTYTKVTVEGLCTVDAQHAASKLRIACKSSGSIYYGNEETNIVENLRWFSKEWTTNPAGGNWTDSAIDNLEVGIGLYHNNPNQQAVRCWLLRAKVEYLLDINPEIRVTQCFLKVNYTPLTNLCTLNKPEKISVNHSENIKMLNFWDGTREVYGLNRSGKSMVLIGSEYQSDTCNKTCPCERIACIKGMGKDGSTMTVSGLSFGLFNGDYKIRSFGWKHISEKPEYYTWILELEDTS